MKTCYVDLGTRAIADLVCPGELTEGWTITRINVPTKSRGKGIGSVILQHILEDADREGVKLWLEVSPGGGLDYGQLEKWYGRYGFKYNPLGYMVRIPELEQRNFKEKV